MGRLPGSSVLTSFLIALAAVASAFACLSFKVSIADSPEGSITAFLLALQPFGLLPYPWLSLSRRSICLVNFSGCVLNLGLSPSRRSIGLFNFSGCVLNLGLSPSRRSIGLLALSGSVLTFDSSPLRCSSGFLDLLVCVLTLGSSTSRRSSGLVDGYPRISGLVLGNRGSSGLKRSLVFLFL